MPKEVNNSNSKGSSKLVLVIVALVAVVGILFMLSKKTPPPAPVAEEPTKEVQAAELQDPVKRPAGEEAPAEEEYKEPEKNAETTWMIEDFTDTKRSWEKYKLKNVQITSRFGARVFHAKNVEFSDVKLMPQSGDPLVTFNAEVSGMEGRAWTEADARRK